MQRVTIGLLFFSTVMCEASRANLLIDCHGIRRAIHVLVNLLDVGQEALQGRLCDLHEEIKNWKPGFRGDLHEAIEVINKAIMHRVRCSASNIVPCSKTRGCEGGEGSELRKPDTNHSLVHESI